MASQGPRLPHCLVFSAFAVSLLLDVGTIPQITLSIPLCHRWVLFEEKLEVEADRWSAPHVPTLALPSLQKLRNLLAKGLVLLDCPAQSLLELVGRMLTFSGKCHFPGMSPSLGIF